MKVDKRKLAAGVAAGVIVVGVGISIKFIPQKTRDINDADGRGTKVSAVQNDTDKENKTTQKDKDNDKTEDKTKSEDRAGSKDKEEVKTSKTQKTTTTNNKNNNTNNGSQSSKSGSQNQSTTPPTTKHTHNYSIKGETVAPTYDTDGYTVYKCSCGAETKGDWVKKLEKPSSPERNYAYASQFLSLLNGYRASLGLNALGMEGFMQEHCMQRANDLVTDFSHNHHGHDPLSGCPRATDSYGESIPKYLSRGECIGGSVPADPESMLAAFKQSSAHNAILTNPEATYVGIGVVSYKGSDYYCVSTYSLNDGT